MTRHDFTMRPEAIRLRVEERLSKEEIGRRLGKGREWIRDALAGVEPPPKVKQQQTVFQTPPKWEPDQRSKCARLMGDPAPGRSALDQRQRA